jgi:hypothetical protein
MIERTKAFIKTSFPGGVRIYRRFRDAVQTIGSRAPRMEDIFSDIYRNNAWEDPESVSGHGSTLARTEVIRSELPNLLESVGARSLLDAPCGDFKWLQHVGLGEIEYTGADVVTELIERNRKLYGGARRSFVVLDITSDRLPKADVILCRDCFIHLSYEHIRVAVANFKASGSAFLLTTTQETVWENTDTETGGWRPLNLRLPPFNFPEPLRLITENEDHGKCLGMWSLEQL